MEVFCPECGVCFMPHDEENPVVCPVCEWEFNVLDLDTIFDDWDDLDWGEDGDDTLRGGIALILAGDNEDA